MEVLRRLHPFIGAIILLILWWLIAWLRVVDPVLLPSPDQAFVSFYRGLVNGSLWNDFYRTIVRTASSFALATVVAVPLGILLGASEKVYDAVELLVDFFRSTPSSALFPLFLVIFGTGELTKIAVASFGAALAILFNVAYGVKGARKQRQLAAKVMGASRLRVLTDVTLFESLPQTFVGLRNGISIALVIVIVAEMFIGSTDGLGQRIMNSQMVFDMPQMYAAILAAGILGYALNLVFLHVERRFVHWGGK